MATKITSAVNGDVLTGSNESRIDVAPDGTLWTAIVDPNTLRWFRSTNGGATWSYSSGSDLALGQYNGAVGIFIDADGYAHASVQRYARDPQDLLYARGRPKTGGGWTWTTLPIRPASGRMGVDTDVKAFRLGTGWVAFCLWNTSAGTRVARVDITSNHELKLSSVNYGPSDGYDLSFGGIDFVANADGKTPVSSPDLYLATAAISGGREVRVRKATHESGRWTWGSPVVAASSQNVGKTAMTTVHDGVRFMLTWATSAGLFFSEWTGSGSTTTRNPPALPSGTGEIYATSLSVDAQTKDVYLLAYGGSKAEVIASKLTRSTGSWGAWATVGPRSAAVALDGKVQAVRHPRGGSVDFVYADVLGSTRFDVQFAQIVGTVTEPETPTPVTPNAPTLLSPGAGAQIDLSNGGTFTWRHAASQAGDRQQAWQLRKVTGSTTTYWNQLAQGFSGTATWNTGESGTATFGAGQWPVGTHSWSVRTRSSIGGADSPWASNRSLVSTESPVVNVTGPSGLYYDDSTPVVEWTYLAQLPQRSFEIRIVPLVGDPSPDSGVIWQSGVVASATARRQRIDVSLNSGVGYRVYVRATNSQGVTSAWAYSEFVVSLEPPTGPQVGVTDYVSYETGVPRARLDLVARSNFMSASQSRMQTGWENRPGTSFEYVDADLYAGIEQGVKGTKVANAVTVLALRTVIGTPPAAPFGMPPLTGPVNFPVTEGQTYTFLVYVRSDTNIRSARAFIQWRSGEDGLDGFDDDTVNENVTATVGVRGSTILGESYGEQKPTTLDSYTQFAVTAMAPLGAQLAKPHIELISVPTGEVHYFSRATLHPGRSLLWQQGGYADQQTLRVQRSDDDGSTWATVGERIKPNFRQEATFFDRSAPFGRQLLYRAYTDVDTTIGGVLSSGVSDTSHAYVESSVWAIRDLTDDLAELQAYVTAFDESDTEAAQVLRPAGRFYPIVDTEGNQASEGSLEIYVPRKDADAMVALLRRGTTLLVQNPRGRTFRARFLTRNLAIEQIADRKVTANYVEVS